MIVDPSKIEEVHLKATYYVYVLRPRSVVSSAPQNRSVTAADAALMAFSRDVRCERA